MPTLREICACLHALAPPSLAEDWDNVGLLTGDPAMDVARVMTCLTVTPESAGEAVARQADLVVSHHPLPFRPVQRLVTDTTVGRLLWQLTTHRIAVYSPHTAFDSARHGINQHLAAGLGLEGILPLLPIAGAPADTGRGRMGCLPQPATLHDVIGRLKQFLTLEHLHYVGALDHRITRVGVACGAAGEFLLPAREAGCHLLVLGETNLHTCLEALATGVALALPGHFASERFGVERLADELATAFPQVEVWASADERDPLAWA